MVAEQLVVEKKGRGRDVQGIGKRPIEDANSDADNPKSPYIPANKRITGKGGHRSFDDQLAMLGNLIPNRDLTVSEAGKHRSRSTDKNFASGSPPREKGGDMYYKIDPHLMTRFMENVRSSQAEITSDLKQQHRWLSSQENKNRQVTESLISVAMNQMNEQH